MRPFSRVGRLQGSSIPLALFFVAMSVQAATAQFAQQGAKLVGTGYAVTPFQGNAVAISANGSTAIIAAGADNSVFVFTRTGTTWTQQGSKLSPSDAVGQPGFGSAVAISSDGNTALIGGYNDGNSGATWVFTRSGGIWTQQGPKLVGSGAVGNAVQGATVALSGDGNTALIGGPVDNNAMGAAWVFTRSAGVWTQSGAKLVGAGSVYANVSIEQGTRVALSGDGTTALIGGFGDNGGIGATWVFVLNGGVWTQQGSKLVGTGNGTHGQGQGVALSSDGNTAIIGSYDNQTGNGGGGIAFTRSAGVWTQQGGALIGTGTGSSTFEQGIVVSLSGDGNIAIISDLGDITGGVRIGAVWVFARNAGQWTQQGGKVVGTGYVGVPGQGSSVALSADGMTLLVGGPNDNNNIGATWVFALLPDHFNITAPAAVTSGTSFSVTVAAADKNNAAFPNYTGTVHFSSNDGAPTLPGNYPFVTADNGSRTFSVTLRTVGSTDTVSVADTAYGTVTGTSANITVNPAVSVSPATLPHATYGLSGYSQMVTATGGTGALVFSHTGTIPPGMNFNDASGNLSGTPTAAGSFNFTVTSTDSIGATGSRTYTFTVDKAAPNLSWTTPADITYGAALDASVLNASSNVPGAFTYTPNSGTVLNAGNNQTLNASFTPNDTANYLGGSTSTSVNVLKKALTVTGGNLSRAYGAANPALSGTIVGIANGDNITATYSTNAVQTSVVGPYNIVPTLLDPNSRLVNYSVTLKNGVLTVAQASLTAAAFNVARSYGSANPTFSGVILGVVNGDNILAVYNTAATQATPIGSYPIVPSLLDPDSKLGNYSVSLSNGTLTIGKANLSVIADNLSRTYGAANPTLTGVITGIQNSDNISATYATSATPSSPVGNYSITPAVADPSSKLGNYSLTVSNGMLSVGKAPLVVTPANVSKTYGDANPVLSGTVSGVQNGDAISASYSTLAAAASGVGAYAITATVNDPGNALPNYALTLNTGTLTINPAALSVVVGSATRIYGAPDPVFTGTLSGVVNGDTITATFSAKTTVASSAGTYPITAALADPGNKLGNYTLAETDGTLTIQQSVPVLSWPPPARIFAGVPLDQTQLSATAADVFSSAPIPGTFTYTPAPATVLAPGLAQTLSVTFTPNDAVDYTTTNAQTTLDVDPAIPPAISSALSATAAINAAFAYTITADGSAPLVFSATGLPAGLALNGADIGGNPTASGVFNVTLTATNYGGSDSKNLKLIVVGSGTNHAPAIVSPPTVSANPAVVGMALTFTAQATDADGDALDYAWDFGDGTVADGASVSKIFAVPGVYVVTVTASDGQASATQSVDLVVNAQASQDTFAVTKVKLGFSFVKSANDNLSLSGQIPLPPGFFPAGKVVRILIGGFDTSLTLSEKGTSGDKSFSLRSKKGSSTANFSFAVKNRNLFVPLQSLGFSKTASNPSLIFPVIVVLDGTSHFANPALVYTVKVNKLGPQSGSGKH